MPTFRTGLVTAMIAERPGLQRVWVRLGEHDVTLMKPLTFMNLSGDAVREWRERHEISAADLLVVSDDVYLPLGTLRLRASGSSGGHRGLDSIEEALGHRDWSRLRFGVGAAQSSADLREHVLDEFAPEETPALGLADLLAQVHHCFTASR